MKKQKDTKPLMKHLHIAEPKLTENSLNDTFMETNRLMIHLQEEEEKWILDNICKIAKTQGITDLYVLNEDEFKRFVKEMLPLWKEHKKGNEEKEQFKINYFNLINKSIFDKRYSDKDYIYQLEELIEDYVLDEEE